MADSGRQDKRDCIEELLLMGGVKANPGPGADGRQHGVLSRKEETWIFNAAKWSAKGALYQDRMKALLSFFPSGSIIFQRIVTMSEETDGQHETQEQKWDALVSKVKALVPKTALTKQDCLRQMKK